MLGPLSYGILQSGAAEVALWTPASPTTDGGVSPRVWEVPGVENYQDAAKTTPAGVGDVVGAVTNQGSDTHDITQATTANKPTLQEVTINDVTSYVWRFDGTNDFIQGEFGGAAIGQPYTAFVVARQTEPPVGGGDAIYSTGDVNRLILRVTTVWNMYAGTFLSGTARDNNPHIWTAIPNGATSKLFIDGNLNASGNAGTEALDGLTVGARHDGQNPWKGDIGPVLIYAGDLSPADKNQVGQYLERVTGIARGYPAWTLPTGREDAGGECYPTGGKLYVFGGDDSTTALADIIRIDISDGESTICATLPAARYKAPTVWDSVNSVAYIYGGRNDTVAYTSVLMFDPSDESVATLTEALPSASVEFGAAFDSDQGVAYLFGGTTGTNSNTLLTRILKHDPAAGTITTLAEVLPVALASQAGAYVPAQQAIYLFGGGQNSTESPRAINTIYKFDCATETISDIAATLPTIRDSIAAAYSPTQDRIYLFGGHSGLGGGTYYDSVLEFNPNTETITTLTSTLPDAVDDFPVGYDSVNDVFYLMATSPVGAADNDITAQKQICRFTPPDNGVVQL